MRLAARRGAWAVAGGLLLFAGHPPWDQAWLGFLALVPLLALARDVGRGHRPWRSGLGWGLVAGLVFFAPLLVWLSRFGMAPWLVLALLQSVFVAAFVAVVAAWGERPWRPLVAVVAWVAFEWARSFVPLNGFPWGVLAYTQHDGGPALLVARMLGVMGVSAVLAAVAASVEQFAVVVARGSRSLRAVAGPALGLVMVGVLMLVVPAPPPSTGETVDMAGVQGNDVDLPAFVDRTDSDRIADIADRMVAVTSRLADAPAGAPDVVVWPENALDSDPRAVPEIRQKVAEAQRSIGDATLLAGALLNGDVDRTFRNTVVRFGDEGTIEDIYDKRILVPFGEYVPARSLLGGLPPLAAVPSDGVPGEGPHVFDIDGVLVGPVTCYESLFPRLVRDQVRAGAQVLVVSTNNASYGRSPASRQHLAFSQIRAVETGRWVLHAGISGISAVVDPSGGLSQRTDLFEQAIVRADLPLVEGNTPYVRTGDVVGPLAGLLAFLAVGFLLWSSRRQRHI
jgi:apolipoprotein N-acyltransferase